MKKTEGFSGGSEDLNAVFEDSEGDDALKGEEEEEQEEEEEEEEQKAEAETGVAVAFNENNNDPVSITFRNTEKKRKAHNALAQLFRVGFRFKKALTESDDVDEDIDFNDHLKFQIVNQQQQMQQQQNF